MDRVPGTQVAPNRDRQGADRCEKSPAAATTFKMSAYLLTFTCYGSYIPGQQGAIDRDHNVAGSRLPGPRPKLRQHVQASLKQAPYEMDQDQRAIVLTAITDVCRYKCWHLLAAHVRSNHVHTVVDADVAPEAVMNAFKSYASRALNLHVPGHAGRLRWARHGSTRYPWVYRQGRCCCALRSGQAGGADGLLPGSREGLTSRVCPLPDGRGSVCVAHPCAQRSTAEGPVAHLGADKRGAALGQTRHAGLALPAAEPLQIQIDHRGNVQREELRHHQTAHHG